MDLENREVVVYLTGEGFSQLKNLLQLEDEESGMVGLARDVDGFGLWLSPATARWKRAFAIPWHCLRAIEVEAESDPGKEVRKSIGFHG